MKLPRIGFSLVELMVVIAVIGILVSLALPRFRVFIARSRQAEAASNLDVIHKLQKSYNVRWESFGVDGLYHGGLRIGLGGSGGTCGDGSAGTKNTLGFRVEDCNKLRYTYVTIGIGGGAWAENLNPTGRQIYPNCSATPVGGYGGLVSVAQCFGATSPFPSGCAGKDKNSDGTINILDLVKVASSIGSSVNGMDYWAIDRTGALANASDAVEGCEN